MNSPNVIVRYSDKDLNEFKIIITAKLEKAKKEYDVIMNELSEIEGNGSNRFNNINESSLSYERDYLIRMAERQERFVRDLKNALLRIQNKTYGICIITGKLIDKRRLYAVPHTTKSIKAKLKQ